MARPIKGTRDLRREKIAPQVVYGSKDPRQLRCRCGNLATAAPDGKGGSITKCSACGREYRSTSI